RGRPAGNRSDRDQAWTSLYPKLAPHGTAEQDASQSPAVHASGQAKPGMGSESQDAGDRCDQGKTTATAFPSSKNPGNGWIAPCILSIGFFSKQPKASRRLRPVGQPDPSKPNAAAAGAGPLSSGDASPQERSTVADLGSDPSDAGDSGPGAMPLPRS